MCEQEGVDALFLPGNHDPSISDQNYIQLDQGRIVIMHGQTVFPEVSPWSHYYFNNQERVDFFLERELPNAQTIDERFDLAREVVKIMTPSRWVPRASKLHYYLNTLWPPKRLKALLSVKKSSVRASLAFSKEFFPRAEIVIVGHFHRTYFQSHEGVTLINTGAFMSGCQPFLVEIEEDKLIVKRVCFSNIGDCFVYPKAVGVC